MKFNYLSITFLILSLGYARAYVGEIKYPVSQIPKEILKDANAVLRVQETQFTIISPGKAIHKSLWAVTILNKNGDDYATEYFGYDKLKSINSIRASLYNAFGEEVRKLKKSDISDMSAIGSSLYSDDRMKVVEFTYNEYPYTVEYEIEETYNGLLYYPPWDPYQTSDLAIQSSIYQVSVPKGMKLRYKEFNLSNPDTEQSTQAQESSTENSGSGVSIRQEDNQTVYTWQLKNKPVLEKEPFGPIWRERAPIVYLAPSDFEMEGYKGNMDTWENFGKWIQQLNQGRDNLPAATVDQVKKLTQDAPTQEEKIRRVYRFLQEKTRYVSIQLGIGGWQPFEASYVDEKSYGDCKALTNYTHALLESVGVKSYYTLVRAGEEVAPIISDFPSTRFNHVFLCVPQAKDTIWLECTSQTEAFGYLGTFTSDRDVLLITPEGGKLVHTPVYSKKDNLLIRKARVEILEDGNAQAKVSTFYKALQEDTPGGVAELSTEDQKKWLYKHIDIPSFEINQFGIKRQKDRIPSTTIDLDLTLRKMAAKSGKRMFVVPNLMNQWSNIPPSVEKRHYDVILDGKFDFKDADTIVYTFPESYKLEYKPENFTFENQFGKYEAQVKVEGNTIIYIRHCEMNRGRYPKEDYAALLEFFKNVVKADKQKVVLVQKEG